jgi:hypothetical protein
MTVRSKQATVQLQTVDFSLFLFLRISFMFSFHSQAPVLHLLGDPDLCIVDPEGFFQDPDLDPTFEIIPKIRIRPAKKLLILSDPDSHH